MKLHIFLISFLLSFSLFGQTPGDRMCALAEELNEKLSTAANTSEYLTAYADLNDAVGLILKDAFDNSNLFEESLLDEIDGDYLVEVITDDDKKEIKVSLQGGRTTGEISGQYSVEKSLRRLEIKLNRANTGAEVLVGSVVDLRDFVLSDGIGGIYNFTRVSPIEARIDDVKKNLVTKALNLLSEDEIEKADDEDLRSLAVGLSVEELKDDLKTIQLKAICKKFDLKTSGNKTTLSERIFDHVNF